MFVNNVSSLNFNNFVNAHFGQSNSSSGQNNGGPSAPPPPHRSPKSGTGTKHKF